MVQRSGPGGWRAPVMADNDRRIIAERIYEADDILADFDLIVGLDLARLVGLAITTHVRRDHMIAGLGDRIELVAPGIPGFRKAMQKQDKRTFPGFCNIEFDPVCSDPALLHSRPIHSAATRSG